MTEEPIDPNADGWVASYLTEAPAKLAAPGSPVPDGPPRDWFRLATRGGGALLVAIALVLAIVDGTTPKKPAAALVVPTSIGRYQQLTDATADRVRSLLQSGGASLGVAQIFFNQASLGVYGTPGAPEASLLLFIIRTDDATGVQGSNPDQSAQLLISGSVNGPTRYDAGVHGGAVECGSAEVGGTLETACGWYDRRTVGLVISLPPAETPASLAHLSSLVRDNIERDQDPLSHTAVRRGGS